MSSVVEVEGLTVSFPARNPGLGLGRRTRVNAVDGVSFKILEGETFGLAGETGSGKSTIARVLVGLLRPDAGSVTVLGRRIDFRRKDDVVFLRQNVGIVFQDPVGSLNPRLTARATVEEALIASRSFKRDQFERMTDSIVELVGLRKSSLGAYPRELSGGEKQRVSLARALVVPKKLLVLDEPTSSLDVSVQAQVLNTLRTLKSELGLSVLFITHDIRVIGYVSRTLGVLYYGKLVEVGKARDVIADPKHPYAMKLMSNIIGLKRGGATPEAAEGGPSSVGCVYSKGCPSVFNRCSAVPRMFECGEGRTAACFLYENR